MNANRGTETPKAGKEIPAFGRSRALYFLVPPYMPSLARVSSSSRPVTFKPSPFW